MSFNINEFSAEINKMGLAKSNLFYTFISLPPNLSFLNSEISDKQLRFLCKSASLPAMSVSTNGNQPQSYGMSELRPTAFDPQTVSFIFMVDSGFSTVRFFHRWMQSIVNYNDSSGNEHEDEQNKLPYIFEYKDNYVSTVETVVYSHHSTSSRYLYRFGNAYPTNVGEIQVSWDAGAEILSLPVSFTFDRFFVDGMGPTARGNASALPANLPSQGTISQSFPQASPIQDIVNQFTNISNIF